MFNKFVSSSSQSNTDPDQSVDNSIDIDDVIQFIRSWVYQQSFTFLIGDKYGCLTPWEDVYAMRQYQLQYMDSTNHVSGAQTSKLPAVFESDASLASSTWHAGAANHRPSSHPDRLMGGREFDNNSIAHSESFNQLPPLKLRKLNKDGGKNRSKTMKSGYDESFSRPTPRVLHYSSSSMKASQGGNDPASDIESLRRELQVAQQGVHQLSKMVDNNIAWVQSNCDMTQYSSNFSMRTKRKCQGMAAERLSKVFGNYLRLTLFWTIYRWKMAISYGKLNNKAVLYCKAKSIHMMTVCIANSYLRCLSKRWNMWLHMIRTQAKLERDAAAVVLQCFARRHLAKVRVSNLRLGKTAVVIQKLFRKAKAKEVVKVKVEQKLNLFAAMAIQKLFRNLFQIRRAKKEVNKRRAAKAAVRIQKVFRGIQGRDRFQKALQQREMQLKLEQEKKSRSPKKPKARGTDLEGLASSATADHHDKQHSPAKKSTLGIDPLKSIRKNDKNTGNLTQEHKKPLSKTAGKAATNRKPTKPSSAPQKLQQQSAVSTNAEQKHDIENDDGKQREMSQLQSESVTESSTTPMRPPSRGTSTPALSTKAESNPAIVEESRGNMSLQLPPASESGSADNNNDGNIDDDNSLASQESLEDAALKIQKIARGKIGRTNSEKQKTSKNEKSVASRSSASPPKQQKQKPSTPEGQKTPADRRQPISQQDVAPTSDELKPPDEAITKIQKLARGKLARDKTKTPTKQVAKSPPKPVLVDGCVQTDITEDKIMYARVPSAKHDATAGNVVNAVQDDSADFPINSLSSKLPASEKVSSNEMELQIEPAPSTPSAVESGKYFSPNKSAKATPSTLDEARNISSPQDDRPKSKGLGLSLPTFRVKTPNFLKNPLSVLSGRRSQSPASERPTSSMASSKPAETIKESSIVEENDNQQLQQQTSTAIDDYVQEQNSLASADNVAENAEVNDDNQINHNEAVGEEEDHEDHEEGDHEEHDEVLPDAETTIKLPSEKKIVASSVGADSKHKKSNASAPSKAKQIEKDKKLGKGKASNKVVPTKGKADSKPSQKSKQDESISKVVPAQNTVTPQEEKKPLQPDKASIKIQQLFRILIAKARITRKRLEIVKAQKEAAGLVNWAALTMQRVSRGRQGRKKFAAKKHIYMENLAIKQEAGAIKIQAQLRGLKDRKKVQAIKSKEDTKKKQKEWLESYQKKDNPVFTSYRDPEPKSLPTDSPMSNQPRPPSSSVSRPSTTQGVSPVKSGKVPEIKSPAPEKISRAPTPDASSKPNPLVPTLPLNVAPATTPVQQLVDNSKLQELDNKLKMLEDLEKRIKESEEKVKLEAMKAEERVQEQMKLLDERTKQAEADRLAREELLKLAVGPVSHRSPFSTLNGGNNKMPNSSRMPRSAFSTLNSAPPTARSARSGPIPANAPRLTYGGNEWVQLWDSEQQSYYWWCEKTQAAQWEQPGMEYDNNQYHPHALTDHVRETDDDKSEAGTESGYESAGGMTDYSTDYENSYYGSEAGDTEEWQEYWDEQAQAKYWYNNNTVS